MIAPEDYATPPTEWPQRGRGGFMRNFHDEAIVAHPGGGARKLAYDGASSLFAFKPYRGDPVHTERGNFLHDLCDLVDAGSEPDEAFVARGVELGVNADLQAHIAADWQRCRAELGVTTIAVELPVVHDGWRVASNIDRLEQWPGGEVHVGDIKSAADVVKAAYVVQLAAYADGTPYDVDADERVTWDAVADRSGSDG